MSIENHFSEASIRDKPVKKLKLKLREDSVTTDKIANGSVTSEKLDKDVFKDIATEVSKDILALSNREIDLIMMAGSRDDIIEKDNINDK